MRTLIRIVDEANVTVGLQFIYPDSVTLRPFSAIVRLYACNCGRIPSSSYWSDMFPSLVYYPVLSCW
ncbi:conserved hypothetical protein [Agrobacterium genomosp. 13 str. CFBP 6927]|uniref:Uncharacterized protein n=1 Tax=Agrobacterium genomosp. 13 str. CFBP 6927 TaxID=1183428 RepID=A0ABM9VEU8_9HYPH|nr:conserved hypothetical protein [Agrobacterium genomosp. 13 str. CFBP 6927]